MISQRSIASVLGALALAVTMGGTATAAEAPTSSPQAQAPFTFGASAWGSTVKVAGPLLNSGKTAYVALGCTHKDNISKENPTASVEIPGVADLGAVVSTVTTKRSQQGEVYTSTGHSSIANASVFAGEIEFGAIETTATTANGPDGYSADVDFNIASLSIGGVEVELTGDEQVIDVPGIAEIIIGGEKTKVLNRQATASGTAVKITLVGPGGAVIKLGEARASIDGRIVNGFFTGGAYGTTVTVLDTVESGKTANQPLPCVGTQGKDRTNEVATVDLGGVGEASGIISTVNGDQTPRPDATVHNEIADVELLGELATLEAITTDVHVWEKPNGEIEYTADASIGSIRVGLVVIPLPTLPGQVVILPGVGELTFMEVTELKGGRGVEVIGARVTLLDGTEVVLSRSAATIK